MSAVADLDRISDVIGDAIVVSNVTGEITMWNPAAIRIFGFSEAEALDIIVPERQDGVTGPAITR